MLPSRHAAEQLVDLEPEQRDERLLAGVGQVWPPALACRAEHAVLVDADDGADPDALGSLQRGEGAVEFGAGDALARRARPQPPGCRARRADSRVA